MNVAGNILMRMFGQPHGGLGRLGGHIYGAHESRNSVPGNRPPSDGVPSSRVLEVGFGPGITIDRLSSLTAAGRVAGLHPPPEMAERAGLETRPSSEADTSSCNPVLWRTCHSVTTALISLWQSIRCRFGLMPSSDSRKSGGRIALGFTPYFRPIERQID